MSTSYNSQQLNLLTILAKVINPCFIVEVGTQQGHSAVALGSALTVEGELITCDTFASHYNQPPFAETAANQVKALCNLNNAGLTCSYQVRQASFEDIAKELVGRNIDIIHIDICNHLDNITPILKTILDLQVRFIFLEGGQYNHWQKKYGYQPYTSILPVFFREFCTIPFDDSHALTIARL